MVQQHATPWDLPTLLRDVPGRQDFARPLAPLTSIRIGGPADACSSWEVARTSLSGMVAFAALSCCYAVLFARAV